jgi:hypothetical protein
MSATTLRIAGLVVSLLYAGAVIRVYVRQPASLPEVTGSLTSSVGVYRIDQARFDAGLSHFRAERFLEARDAFAQADPARQDPTVQFYTSYSYLREGWGHVYDDATLYRAGKATLDHAREIAPHGTILVDDPALTLHTAEELEAEFDRGLTHGVSDLNPMRLLRERP